MYYSHSLLGYLDQTSQEASPSTEQQEEGSPGGHVIKGTATRTRKRQLPDNVIGEGELQQDNAGQACMPTEDNPVSPARGGLKRKVKSICSVCCIIEVSKKTFLHLYNIPLF